MLCRQEHGHKPSLIYSVVPQPSTQAVPATLVPDNPDVYTTVGGHGVRWETASLAYRVTLKCLVLQLRPFCPFLLCGAIMMAACLGLSCPFCKMERTAGFPHRGRWCGYLEQSTRSSENWCMSCKAAAHSQCLFSPGYPCLRDVPEGELAGMVQACHCPLWIPSRNF